MHGVGVGEAVGVSVTVGVGVTVDSVSEWKVSVGVGVGVANREKRAGAAGQEASPSETDRQPTVCPQPAFNHRLPPELHRSLQECPGRINPP